MLNAFQVHAHTYTHVHTHTQACHMCDTHTLVEREGEGGRRYLPVFCESISYILIRPPRLLFLFLAFALAFLSCTSAVFAAAGTGQMPTVPFDRLPPLICYKLFEFRFNLQQLFQYSVLNSIWKSCKVFACAFPDNEYTYHIRVYRNINIRYT